MDTLNTLENPVENNQANHINRERADHKPSIESAILLTIFPKEIWMLIFEKIFPPADLLSLIHSSGLFHKLLETDRTKFLFPKVIKILSHTPNNLFINLGGSGKTAKYLLNCRLVCRAWQIGVDSALQSFNNPEKLIDVPCGQGFYISRLCRGVHFSFQQQPVEFLQQFDENYANKNRNPFIGRSLYIYCTHELIRDPMSFSHQMLQILATYGYHLWSFSFYITFRQPFGPSFWSDRLRDLLQLMPNLKFLKLRCLQDHSSDELTALRLRLESCVFPELKDLKFLHLENVPTPVFDAVLRRYSHVKMLFSYTYWRINDIWTYPHNLPNLTQLELSLRDINKLIQWDTSIAFLPLRTLMLRLVASQVDWEFLFQFLESRWSATLTELKIDFDFYNNHSSQVLPPLNLPNLKVFVFYSNILVSLDFLLPMRNSLERLVIRYRPTSSREELAVEREEEVQFYKFLRNLGSSNIWSLFSNLNTVQYFYSETQVEQVCRRPMSLM